MSEKHIYIIDAMTAFPTHTNINCSCVSRATHISYPAGQIWWRRQSSWSWRPHKWRPWISLLFQVLQQPGCSWLDPLLLTLTLIFDSKRLGSINVQRLGCYHETFVDASFLPEWWCRPWEQGVTQGNSRAVYACQRWRNLPFYWIS